MSVTSHELAQVSRFLPTGPSSVLPCSYPRSRWIQSGKRVVRPCATSGTS